MFFSDKKFIESMNENPVSAIISIIDTANNKINADGTSWNELHYDILLETIAAIEVLIESNGFDCPLFVFNLSGDINKDYQAMYEYTVIVRDKFSAENTRLKMDAHKNQYKSLLKTSFAYEFSQGDMDRIQTLINGLRKCIANMDNLNDNHKERLLKRLEGLQSELRKRLSNLDKFWGIIGDAGVALGKLGNDAKPIVDRIKEISEIVWRTQARAEELPSSSPCPLLNDDKTT